MSILERCRVHAQQKFADLLFEVYVMPLGYAVLQPFALSPGKQLRRLQASVRSFRRCPALRLPLHLLLDERALFRHLEERCGRPAVVEQARWILALRSRRLGWTSRRRRGVPGAGLDGAALCALASVRALRLLDRQPLEPTRLLPHAHGDLARSRHRPLHPHRREDQGHRQTCGCL